MIRASAGYSYVVVVCQQTLPLQTIAAEAPAAVKASAPAPAAMASRDFPIDVICGLRLYVPRDQPERWPEVPVPINAASPALHASASGPEFTRRAGIASCSFPAGAFFCIGVQQPLTT